MAGITQAVMTIFKSKDQTSKNFNKMQKNAKLFGEESAKAFKKAGLGATRFQSVTKGILTAGLVQKALGGVTRGLSAVTTEFIDFDDSITAASAKFQGLDLSTKAGQKTLLQLKKSAREAGATTKFSASEAAAGLDFYATAGFNAAQAMKVLKPTAKLATIANLDLARTSDIASDSIGAFGLMTEDSVQLQKNFTRVSDVMAKTMTSTNTNMEDMFESIKKGGAAFTGAGQEMETFQALMGKMANAGLKGAESGTQLRNIILRLAKPTGEAAALIEGMGIKTADSEGNFRNVIDILGDFEKATSKMGEVQKAATIKTIFGTRSVTGLSVILKEGTKSIKAFETELKNAGGSTEKMAAIMDKSLGNRLKGLKSAAIEVGFQLFSAFGEKGASAIDKMTNFIRKIDLTPLIDGIKSFGAFMEESGALNLLINGVKLLGSTFKLMWSIAKPILNALSFVIIPLVDAASKLIGFLGSIVDKIPGFSADAVAGAEKIGAGIAGGASGLVKDIGEGIGSSKRLIEKLSGSERTAPNASELQSRQNVNLSGQINIAGAPKGSTATSKTTGGQVDLVMLGAN